MDVDVGQTVVPEALDRPPHLFITHTDVDIINIALWLTSITLGTATLQSMTIHINTLLPNCIMVVHSQSAVPQCPSVLGVPKSSPLSP